MPDPNKSGTGADLIGNQLSREQIAQIGYQVGWRGQDLIWLVAIVGRESGYRANAFNGNSGTGDQSYGLMQINMIDEMGPSRRQQFGISSNEELYDPLTNLRAAYIMYQGRGNTFYDWGPYKGLPPTYSTDVGAAEAAVHNADQQGLLGQDWSSGTPGAPPSGGGGSGSAPAQQPVTLPSDARVVKTDMGMFVVFNPSAGVWLHYVVPWGDGTVNLQGHDVEQMTSAQFERSFKGSVNAGSAIELGDMQSTFGSFGRFWNSLLDQIFGRGNPAREDPSVLRAIAEYASRPDMDPMELENILKGSKYWKQHTDAERIWNDLSPAEQNKQRQDMLARMAETWFQFHGKEMQWNDPFMKQWVEDLASGKVSFSLFTKRIRELAKLNPESPWSRQIRDEGEAQRQRGVDIENTAERVRSEALRWGLRWKEGKVQDWAQGIVEKRFSDQDLMDKLRELAAVRYPGKPPDMDTSTWAENYTQSFDELMERSGDVFTPQIQRALKKGLNLHDFETELKNSPEWRSTKNADAAFHATLTKVGEMFGMS